MELTARKAVELSMEMWEWLAETGRLKSDWPEWDCNGGQHAENPQDCFLCVYSTKGCQSCPYFLEYGECLGEDSPYMKWEIADIQEDRKKYAKKFLNQLKKILKDMETE